MLSQMIATGGKRVNDICYGLCMFHRTDASTVAGVEAALDAECKKRHIYGDNRYYLLVIQILAER